MGRNNGISIRQIRNSSGWPPSVGSSSVFPSDQDPARISVLKLHS